MSTRGWWVAATVVAVAVAAATLVWSWSHRTPPGKWKAGYTREQIRVGWAKEREWAAQSFTPVRDDSEFREQLRQIKVRLLTSLSPEALEQFHQVLYDQLVCRHTGSLECYKEWFASGRQNPLGDFRREWVENIYARTFNTELPDRWNVGEIFEKFWNTAYGEHRFQEVALGPDGSLIVIGDVTTDTPDSFFTAEELRRWKAWPGASRRRCVEFHPGARSLSAILAERGKCAYAEVVLTIRSVNDEVWCWATDWYLDPIDGRWQIQSGVAITLRGPYYCPI